MATASTFLQTSGGPQIFSPEVLKESAEAADFANLTTSITFAVFKAYVGLRKVNDKDTAPRRPSRRRGALERVSRLSSMSCQNQWSGPSFNVDPQGDFIFREMYGFDRLGLAGLSSGNLRQ